MDVHYQIVSRPWSPSVDIAFRAVQREGTANASVYQGTLTLCDDSYSRTRLRRAAIGEGFSDPNCRPLFLVSPVARNVLEVIATKLDNHFQTPMALVLLATDVTLFSALGTALGFISQKVIGGSLGGGIGALVGAGVGIVHGSYLVHKWSSKKSELKLVQKVLVLACRYQQGTAVPVALAMGMADIEDSCRKKGGAAQLAYTELLVWLGRREPGIVQMISQFKNADAFESTLDGGR